ncbi:alpha/beta hydrolase [Amycolatopsis sp.]|uniref:alpha/beta hydrolase n=1 Tax=Amycolatopsis sp. TaxID=37632 RepID=UPI002B74E16D|nr:alpha/beta hydrolase [Amycolatopsis sp.]HVV14623.1 alpha/beta hydrolase [Amycolatopsis sp.]
MSAQQRAVVEEMLRTGPLDIGGDVAGQRPVFEELMTAEPLAADVVTTTEELGGVPAVRVGVAGRSPVGTILYFHGGGYALGTAASSAGLASGLARHSGGTVISVDYRLAPENPYPAALEDAVAAYRGLLDAGVAPESIAIAGESAGGGLAIATVVAPVKANLARPAAAVVFSPWADLTGSGESMTTKAGVDPSLTPAGLRRRAADYVAGRDPADPAVSPVFADLTGLPPLLVQAGSHEILLDDATRLAARPAAADVDVTLEVTAGVPHVFQGFAALLDEGAAALARAGIFLGSHLAVEHVPVS